MRAGLVLGAVWATKKSPALTGQSLLRVRCGETEYLAADLVGAGPGDRVILAFGAAARAGRPDVPVDAAIVAILDETEQLMDNIILWIMAIAHGPRRARPHVRQPPRGLGSSLRRASSPSAR